LSRQRVRLEVDGVEVSLEVEARMLLSDALREACRRRRVHVGCEQGVCGSCTVLVDGEPIRSCLALAVEMEGRAVVTLEGLASDALMQAVTAAILKHGGLQCGYCTPGMALAIHAAISRADLPKDAEGARELLEGHLCRCTGYAGLVQAILALSHKDDAMRAHSAVTAGPS
jgi:aerobic-type carbon monoxide dehydrogenase small subunit (CoxS/CutS family)